MASKNPEYYFNSFYIDFVRSIFFANPEKAYSQQDLEKDIPGFCNDGELVSSAINILHMAGIVKHELVDGIDRYKITKEAILKDKTEKENDALNKKIDLQLKQLNKDNFFTPRNISLASVFVAFCSLLVASVTLFKSCATNQQHTRIEQQHTQKISQTLK